MLKVCSRTWCYGEVLEHSKGSGGDTDCLGLVLKLLLILHLLPWSPVFWIFLSWSPVFWRSRGNHLCFTMCPPLWFFYLTTDPQNTANQVWVETPVAMKLKESFHSHWSSQVFQGNNRKFLRHFPSQERSHLYQIMAKSPHSCNEWQTLHT